MNDRQPPQRPEPPPSSAASFGPHTALLAVIALTMIGFVAYVTRPFMVLVVLAAFLAILLSPLNRWLEKYVTRWGALAGILVLIGATLTAIGLAFFVQGRSIAEKAPEYTQRLKDLSEGLLAWVQEQGLNISWDEVGTKDAMTQALGFVGSGVESVIGIITQTLLVLIMLVFMLMEADSFHNKLVQALGTGNRDRVDKSLTRATKKIQRYITVKTLVSLTTGMLTWGITSLIGLDFAFIWGAIAFQLNFIPYLGSVIAVFPPTAIALLQFDDPTPALLTFFVLGGLQFSIGNIIEPRIMGRTLSLSPTVVFLSLLFWGWFWGPLGVVLSVPLTAVLKTVCQYTEPLKPIALILGDGTEREDTVGELPQDADSSAKV